jgi:hypothetical protein
MKAPRDRRYANADKGRESIAAKKIGARQVGKSVA